jgi:hypothetical protein
VTRPGFAPTVRALCRVCASCVATGLVTCLVCGCVELPGICYNVLLDERPSEGDCMTLTSALTAKLGLQLQPSLYQCSVILDDPAATPARRVVVNAYFRQRRIVVEIDELRAGSPTSPSPGTREFAQQVMQIVHEQFPTAERVRFTSKRGPFAP